MDLQVQAWLPDECKHCGSLLSLPVTTVTQKFQISALLVSCFTCTAGWASPEQQQALLKAERLELLALLDTREEEAQKARVEHGGAADVFAPGPKALADFFLRQA